MTLGELVLFFLLILTGLQFWRIRSISEQAYLQIGRYCETHHLQLLSVARKRTRLSFKYGKIDWLSSFAFEFSGNGEDRYTGHVDMIGKHVIRTQLPPYKV
ncbi:DUF3301 domain-containing protein [Salinimonas iocasae]|uniref:DUF3301 domain-containing protein n=1 Tax=Salinimonas iocasae TaxID=2572577 RepID=A0A5B7YG27_9ALTE|nr:DUF3301 domain-containing protein [Salinimonas iocasae]QCZ94330.1 DUF3301 domain-containing protein [Salinimonas iocasae]|tara:strand:- start:178 stop:480 length:303 start_codon:yes stop_codon:yes gene_type:complete